MKKAIVELNQIIQILERKLPASINANRKLEDALKLSMSQYFGGLEKAFPYHKLSEVYYSNIKEAVAFEEDDDWIDWMINAFKADLLYRLNSHLGAIYIAGSMQMMSYGKTAMGIPILYEGPPVKQAVEWAETHCAQLVTKMNDETKSRLAKVISDGIQNKSGLDQLSRDIRKEFSDMSKFRADMIAQTETNAALSKGSIDRMRAMGIEGKEWVAVDDPCDDCELNAAQGVIPIEDDFQSGDSEPPCHPNCRCALAPARLNKED